MPLEACDMINKNIFMKILCPKIFLELATIDNGSRHLFSVQKEVAVVLHKNYTQSNLRTPQLACQLGQTYHQIYM